MKATADLVQLAQLATEHSRALMAVMGPIGAQGDEDLTAISLASAGRHMLDASVWFSGFRDHLASRERTSAELLDQILRLVEVMQEKAQEFHRRFHELAAARFFESDEPLPLKTGSLAEWFKMIGKERGRHGNEHDGTVHA